ncbi:RTA1-domain-containing protein [Stipitochalara longipes BDJ]|nr:RTA1-domain-containing protein [Stipitochalara longipes BDJ]
MARSEEDPQNPWLYDPSYAAAIVVAWVYFLTTAIHSFQAAVYKTRFCIPLIIGGIWETLGYTIRAVGAKKEESVALYAVQLTLVVLAPAFVAAFNYMLFGRILRTYSSDTKPKALGVSDTWITRLFVGFDVVSFLTQSAGAAMLAGSKDDIKKSNTGQHIVIGGLVLQLVAFGFFTAIAVSFHLKMKRSQRLQGSVTQETVKEWRPLLFCLYASCILIMLRSVYRVVEFSQGFDGYLVSHEVYFYVLEAVPMMPPFILFNVFHPGRIVKGGFLKRSINAKQPAVLEEGLKSDGDGTDISMGNL